GVIQRADTRSPLPKSRSPPDLGPPSPARPAGAALADGPLSSSIEKEVLLLVVRRNSGVQASPEGPRDGSPPRWRRCVAHVDLIDRGSLLRCVGPQRAEDFGLRP